MRQGAALDELRRRARADELAVARRRAAEGVERRKEQMQAQIERVLPLSRALAAAHRRDRHARLLRAGDLGPLRPEAHAASQIPCLKIMLKSVLYLVQDSGTVQSYFSTFHLLKSEAKYLA